MKVSMGDVRLSSILIRRSMKMRDLTLMASSILIIKSKNALLHNITM